MTPPSPTLPTVEAVYQPDDEAVLIERAQAGDREAFDVLYQRHQGAVLHFALSQLHNLADAEDIASETFVTALDRLDTFRGETDFATWLLGIAWRRLARRWRWQQHHPETELPPEWNGTLVAPGPDPEEMTCLRLEVARLLSRLTPMARQVLVLQHMVGLPPHEVARSVGLSKRTVFRISSRARASLTETPNWAAPARQQEARARRPALCACGCGAELPADRPAAQRCATRACRDRLRHQCLNAPAAMDPATDKVLAVITASGPDGIARCELGRRTRLQAARLDRIVTLLSARGQVRRQREYVARTPTTRYFALPKRAAGRAA